MDISVFGVCSCREDWVDIVMTLRNRYFLGMGQRSWIVVLEGYIEIELPSA